MLDLKELKDLHDKAFVAGQTVRERAADDILFYHVTQWDDALLAESELSYRGQFDILRKAGRQIISDLRTNPVQVDFRPVEEDREKEAEILDGLYRAGTRENTSMEAFDNASMEAVVCGVGAWELYTEYVTNKGGDTKQAIRRRPLYEANNQVFWDPNAKLIDKSDAQFVSCLVAYSEDGYRQLVIDLTGEDPGPVSAESFAQPEHSYTFIWLSDDRHIYVTNFYFRDTVKERYVVLADPFGEEVTLQGQDAEDQVDSLVESGYSIVSEKAVDRYRVTKYIASGAEILSTDVIAGEEIAVIPSYGERAYVEGTEYYEGITRLAKDPQRLRNFQLSYLADIVSRSPRPKPIFTQDQVQDFEFMYEDSGADNNFPYYLQNRLSKNGEPLPLGPVGVMPEQNIPSALIASIQLSREAVEDVANPGLPQDIADPDVSGKAVLALQSRLDQQSLVYQQNRKMAKRRDGMVYASMASDIYDSPRKVSLIKPDDQREFVNLMEPVVDKETGETVTTNDLSNVEFDVWADIGPDYSSLKEQTLDRLDKMIQILPPNDPMRNILLLKSLRLMNGVEFDDVREYANKQLMLQGIKEPETDEEKAFMQESQQEEDVPSAEMVLSRAEMLKAQAAQMREQRQAMKDQADVEGDRMDTQIAGFKAETDRMDTQINAQKAKADIDSTKIDSFGKKLDNTSKMANMAINRFRASVNSSQERSAIT